MIQTQYAISEGVSLAYQVMGDADLNLIYVPGASSHLIAEMSNPSHARYIEGLSRFSRVIRFDKRGTGLLRHRQRADLIEAAVHQPVRRQRPAGPLHDSLHYRAGPGIGRVR